jgi:hypothetical protein
MLDKGNNKETHKEKEIYKNTMQTPYKYNIMTFNKRVPLEICLGPTL